VILWRRIVSGVWPAGQPNMRAMWARNACQARWAGRAAECPCK